MEHPEGMISVSDYGGDQALMQEAAAKEIRKWGRARLEFTPETIAWAAAEFGGGEYSILADVTQGVIRVCNGEWTKMMLVTLAFHCEGTSKIRLQVPGCEHNVVPFVAVPDGWLADKGDCLNFWRVHNDQ